MVVSRSVKSIFRMSDFVDTGSTVEFLSLGDKVITT